MGKRKKPELRASEARTAEGKFPKGTSGNPGGQSKEKREFLERLKGEDADDVYDAMMSLVRKRNATAVLRAWEYIVGKPKEMVEVAIPNGLTVRRVTIDPKKLTTEQLAALHAAVTKARVE